jgi:lipoprotein-anchoring transpeptidase ErfK/SrfK
VIAGLPLGLAMAQVPPPGVPPAAATQAPPAAGTVQAAPAVPGQPGDPSAAAKKPRKFWIDGKYRELKKGEVRPYTPPNLPPEPDPQPSAARVFEVAKPEEGDPQVLARPYYGSPMVGTVVPGTRIAVRGEVIAKSSRWCHSKRWFAVMPFGWMCSDHGKATDAPATTDPVYKIVPGERVPYRYVMVSAQEMPMWTSLDAFKNNEEPERKLAKGDSVAIEKNFKHEGETYLQSVEGKILPAKGTYQMPATSQWHGVLIDDKTHLPFGWVLSEQLKAQAAPDQPTVTGMLKRRVQVDILEEMTVKGKRWLRVKPSAAPTKEFPLATEPLPPPPIPVAVPGTIATAAKPATPTPAAPVVTPTAPAVAVAPATPAPAGTAATPPAPPVEQAMWVPAWAVNEVRQIAKPAGIGVNAQWFDADLSEQVLVAYENDKPVYATLVSSGKNNATPLGIYPVWARVAAITMKSQPYDDKPYFVNMVPWSTFFQAHNAIHGAYWHDRFGYVKSHGCINVAPLDARYVFELLKPAVPPGWTSVRPTDVTQWPMLYVHDSGRRPAFHQDRPIGAPDREDESERFEETNRLRIEQGLPPLPPPGTKPPAAATPGAPAAAAPVPAAAPAPITNPALAPR